MGMILSLRDWFMDREGRGNLTTDRALLSEPLDIWGPDFHGRGIVGMSVGFVGMRLMSLNGHCSGDPGL